MVKSLRLCDCGKSRFMTLHAIFYFCDFVCVVLLFGVWLIISSALILPESELEIAGT